QTNRHAAAWQARAQLGYASDTRGSSPFVPLWNGEAGGCGQIPTTLPTPDELIGRERDPVPSLLAAPASGGPPVFARPAELEGGELASLLERLLDGWRAQGYEIVSLAAVHRALEANALPRHEVVYGEVPGRSGTLAVQGPKIGSR